MNQAPHPKLLSKKLLKSEVPNAQAAKPILVIVSPALASANNGNWQTAWRWARMLRPTYHTTIAQDQASSAVYGMPRAAAELDAAQMILPLSKIGPVLRGTLGARSQ